MENKKQITIIALAIFSIALSFMFIDNPVYAHETTDTIYNVTTDNSGRSISGRSNHNSFDGEEFTSSSSLVGESFNRVTVTINCLRADLGGGVFDDLEGTAFFGVWDGTVAPTNANMKRTISSFEPVPFLGEDNCISGGTGGEEISFTMSAPYTIESGDVIGLYYDYVTSQSGTSLSLRFTTSDAFNSSSTRESYYGPNSGPAWNDVTTNDIRMTLSLVSGSTSACIDTNLDGTTDLCFTDTNNDGIADNGVAGSLGAFQSNANVTQMGTTWFCSFNIGDACDNPNVQTNGVGVFYLGIIIIFSYAILVSIHIMAVKASGKNVVITQALMIHPVLLLVTLFFDTSLAWYLGFIEDIIFYSVLVLMVGLGGFGVYRMVTKDN